MKVNSVKQVWLIVLLWLCSSSAFGRQPPLKVACIGNSVTYGYGLPNREVNSYPARLQQLLGAGYQVKNFGVSGSTLLKNGHRAYDTTSAFAEMLHFAPDIAIIHLGLNDTDPRDWPDHRDEFIPDYHALIDTIRRVNPQVKVFVCRLTPVFHEHPRFKSGTRNWYWQIQSAIERIAKTAQVGLVDLHTPLYAHPELFPDALHPDTTGAAIIAQTVYSRITGKYGGLQLAAPFSSHMVLQRRQPLKLYGKADEGEEVTVELLEQRKRLYAGMAPKKSIQLERLHAEYTGIQRGRIHADSQGHWEISFPAMEAGGPYRVKVSTGRKVIVLEDVMIGEVWICSGQSNMAFPLKDAIQEAPLNGAALRSDGRGNNPLGNISQGTPSRSNVTDRRCGNNPNIRLLHMKPLAPTDNVAWDTVTLRKVNQLQYFSGSWEISDTITAAGFSAVGWFFANKVQETLKVPVGIIEVAVGGSTTESWIDRFTMEQDASLTDELYRWRSSDFYQSWCRQRADTNLKNSISPLQRHPYDPCYNYEAGIRLFTAYPMQGVIWYQGESNTHNVEQHDLLLPALVSSWRKQWNRQFPFYYVQLSSINRPSWPVFREHQLELLKKIPRSGMAVSSDMGDSTNVHPRRKKEVGERLAALALHFTYQQQQVVPYGPMPLKATVSKHEIKIAFRYAGKQLKTSDGNALRGFVVEDDKGRVQQVKAIIAQDKIIIPLPAYSTAVKVSYGHEPFTRANLLNEAGLPAPNFTLNLNEQ